MTCKGMFHGQYYMTCKGMFHGQSVGRTGKIVMVNELR